MKAFAIAGIAAGVLAALVLSGISIAEKDRVESDAKRIALLADLSRQEVESRELVLAIRNRQVDTFDGLVAVDRHMKRSMTMLGSTTGSIEESEGLRVAFEDYRSSVEHFKRARSLERNSLRYLPELAREAAILSDEMGRRELAIMVAGTAIDLSQSFRSVSSLRTRLQAIRERGRDVPQVARFVAHSDIVLDSGREVDAQIAALREHPLATSLRDLTAAYSASAEARSARLASIGMVTEAIWPLALCAMGLALFGLRRSAQLLRETNDGLEEEVRSRSSALAQAQKLESIGQLAAGIAHEINTPAQFVSDNLEFIEDSIADLEPFFEAAAGVTAREGESGSLEVVRLREAADRADVDFLAKELPGAVSQSRDGIARVAEIVRAMKDFSHPGSEGLQRVDLNRAIQSTATVARNEWKYVAHVHFDLEADLPSIPCRAGEVNQCVLNILVNAAHAIGDKQDGREALGNIWLSTRRDHDFVRVEIRDDGGGIPAEVQSRVFDPFFTTKGVGKGTGQGLSIAYAAIVEKHGGSLGFEVEEGVGTTFVIRLPLEQRKGCEA